MKVAMFSSPWHGVVVQKLPAGWQLAVASPKAIVPRYRRLPPINGPCKFMDVCGSREARPQAPQKLP